MKIVVFWFRRDLRLQDNTALNHALNTGLKVLPVFIFDNNIINELPVDDARIGFIYNQLKKINSQLKAKGSSLRIFRGNPLDIWEQILSEYQVVKVFTNKDYEPYALERDNKIESLLKMQGVQFQAFKDQVIFEENEILKPDNKPYTVFTPYKKKWLQYYHGLNADNRYNVTSGEFYQKHYPFPSIEETGFKESSIKVRDHDLSMIGNYQNLRDFPAEDATSYLSPHLRFGTVSIREIIKQINHDNEVFLGELIWREFFMQILFHFPGVINNNFNKKYNNIVWRNNEKEFEHWCNGETGYPIVDAGMRQLNKTGYMHNRVRMVAASFLCKHLLIDWRWGEAYFAKKLLDYELSSNNGNWQWAAGTGCDAAPYFRIFNPLEQQKKFDKEFVYIKKWLPEFGKEIYTKPIVEHTTARLRALEIYKKSLNADL